MIYFDNSATSPMHDSVINIMSTVQKQFIGNPSSLHGLGVNAHTLMEKARTQMKQILGIQKGELIITSGGTESNNSAILGSVVAKQGKHIITSSIEHPSVTHTMAFLEKMGYSITYLPVNEKGIVSVSDLENAITDQTCLVSIMWVNNEIGSIQPIEQLASVLEKYPTIHFHVDAVQALSEVLANGIPSRVDLLSLSAHKFHGPRGLGLLYKKHGRVIEPLLHGGGQENDLRSGTENVASIVATSRALREYVEKQGQVSQLSNRLIAFLNQFDQVKVLSVENGAKHIVTFALVGIRGETLVHALENHHIYISTTSACSSKLKKGHHTLGAMNIPTHISQCAVRVSFSKWNTQEELMQFEDVFTQLHQKFQKVMTK